MALFSLYAKVRKLIRTMYWIVRRQSSIVLSMLCMEWRVQKWRRDTAQRDPQTPSFQWFRPLNAFEVLLASAQGEEKRKIGSTWNPGGCNSEGISWSCSWISASLCKWGLIRKALETAEHGSFRRLSWVDSGDSGSGEGSWYLIAGVTQMWHLRTARGDWLSSLQRCSDPKAELSSAWVDVSYKDYYRYLRSVHL